MEWLKSISANLLLFHSIIAILIVLFFTLASKAFASLLGWIGRKIIARTETSLDDRILAVVVSHLRPVMIVVGFMIGVREIRKGTTIDQLTANQMLDYAGGFLYVVLVVIVVKILLSVLSEVIDWYLEEIAEEKSGQLRLTLSPLLNNVMTIIVGMIAIIIILDHFGINIGSLLVSLGVGSLAVALAAQDTLANMIAGFVILVDRPFRVGDRIELNPDMIGDVQEIGLRSTKMLNFDSNLIIIPNSDLVKGRIINHAYPFHQMRARVKVGVAYGTDPEKVRTIMLGLATQHPDILPDPAPEVHFTAMNDSSIEFTLMARASNFAKRFAAETMIREQVYLTFEKEGIVIPFPQRVVHMKALS